MKRVACALFAAGIGLAVAVSGCAPRAERQEAEREEIRQLLEEYLPRLGRAYAEGSVAGLERWAAIKEVASVDQRINELAQQGRLLEPEFRSLAIEEVDQWSHSNAYVTTSEVWDLKVLSTGSRQLLSEEAGQRSRVKYQLKREDDRWRILFRTIVGEG